MKLVCGVCLESLLFSVQTVSACPCGHIFHDTCLLQWIGTSSSCPHCRQKAPPSKIIRKLYFVSSEEAESASPADENDQVEETLLRLYQVQEERDALLREKHELSTKLSRQSNEVSQLKEKLNDRAMKITYLKSDVKLLKEADHDAQIAKKQVCTLQKQLTLYRHVQLLVEGNADAVEEEVSKLGNCNEETRQVTLYVVLLKKQMLALKEEKVLQKTRRRELERTNEGLRRERDSLHGSMSKLQEDNNALEQRVKNLESKLSLLQQAMESPTSTSQSLVHRVLMESPMPAQIVERKRTRLEECSSEESFSKRSSFGADLSPSSVCVPQLLVQRDPSRQVKGYDGLGGSANITGKVRLRPGVWPIKKTFSRSKSTASSTIVLD